MKLLKITLMIVCAFLCKLSRTQVSTLANSSLNTAHYLGWDATTSFALNINHKANSAASNINFLTRNTQRMILTNQGTLGLGHTNPVAMFSVWANTTSGGNVFRTTGLNTDANQWQLFTAPSAGALGTEKFKLFTDAGATPWVNQQVDNALGLRIITPSIAGNNFGWTRMQINGYRVANINGVNVTTSGYTLLTSSNLFLTSTGSPQSPYSLLHLAGSGGNFQQSGHRLWMEDGITFTANDDMCFIGPRAIQDDQTEFVLAISDNSGVSTVGTR